MSVISVSLPESLLDDVDAFADEAGFSGRSEVVRTALRGLLSEQKRLNELDGVIDAVVMVTHHHDGTEVVDAVQHAFQDLITTQMHNHLDDACIELLVLHGPADKIRDLYERLQASNDISQSEILTP